MSETIRNVIPNEIFVILRSSIRDTVQRLGRSLNPDKKSERLKMKGWKM